MLRIEVFQLAQKFVKFYGTQISIAAVVFSVGYAKTADGVCTIEDKYIIVITILDVDYVLCITGIARQQI